MHVSLTYYSGITSRVQKVFFAVLLEKKIEYLLETKVSNRLLLVLGVISPRAKSPFILFDISVFLLLTCVILSMFSGFKVSRGGFFVCFWGNFGIIFFFLILFYKCLRQKCEYVVPEQCMFQ